MSFANTELLPSVGAWFRPLVGRDPYNKKSVDDAQKATQANVKVLEEHLTVNTYLVSERLTLADLSMSFANTELLPSVGAWFRPLVGRDPYNKKSVDDAQKATQANVKVLEEHLTVNTYLVSERLTLADL